VPWWLGVVSMLVLLAAARHLSLGHWRAGAWSDARAAAVLALPWVLFPFIGILAGAPWDPVVSAVAAVLMGSSAFAAVFWLLRTHWARGLRG
jgi:hypothetical protein